MSDDFFEVPRPHTVVKAELVAKYFEPWSRIIRKRTTGRMVYLDLFAGPGRFGDGTPSTPLLVLARAVDDPELSRRIQLVLNEGDEGHAAALRAEIAAFPGVERLTYPPRILCDRVGTETVPALRHARSCPTLSFVDPYGVAGLTQNLLHSLYSGWGCDCIFFLNYSRLTRDLQHPYMAANVQALLGEGKTSALRAAVSGHDPGSRRRKILAAVEASLAAEGALVHRLGLARDGADALPFYVFFVTKNATALGVMKEIMARVGRSDADGVPDFEYRPQRPQQGSLFAPRALDRLKDSLLESYAGTSLAVADVVARHTGSLAGREFVAQNYKSALLELETCGRIECCPSLAQRPRRNGRPTMADSVTVTFPPADFED